MDMVLDPILMVPIRIRFAGTPDADTFHMTPNECARFYSDWKAEIRVIVMRL